MNIKNAFRGTFTAFILKEFKHIFRDRRTLFILFVIPIIQVLLFGYVISNQLKNVKIAVWDKANDEKSIELIQKLTSSGFFILDKKICRTEDIEKAFRAGIIKEVIIIEPNFSKRIETEHRAQIQIIADASDANSANMIVNYTTGIIADYVSEINRNIEFPMRIEPKVRMIYNEELRDVYMFIPGIIAMILMLLSAMMTSISVARERETGTMEVLLVSPLNPVYIVIGKVIPYFILSFINTIVILFIGYFVFEMPIAGSIFLLLAETSLYALLALSLGVLISTVAPSQQTAMMISMFALMLPTILLSGFIFPIENMPTILQYLAAIMPPKYFIIIVKGIMLKGNGIEYVWKETLVLIGMTIVFLSISAVKFKTRLE